MITQHLTSDLVADTSLWRLLLQIGPKSLTALLLGPASAERTIMAHTEPLADTSLAALENAIYDNPLLLSDFASVRLLIDSSEFMLCPAGLTALHQQLAQAMLPDAEQPAKVLVSPMPDGEVLTLLPAEKWNFLQRTFPDAKISDAISPSATWLAYFNGERGNSAHLYAICEPGRMQVVRFDNRGRLAFANVFSTDAATNCAYFILAASGAERIPISVGGFPDLRNAVTDLLRQAEPDSTILPLTLPQNLLEMRRLAPEVPDAMLFMTQL